MAYNVFGNPETDAMVRLIYPEKKVTTHKDRVAAAFQFKKAESKDVNMKKFVHNVKERYGNGISTLCMIYNAMVGTLTYARDNDTIHRFKMANGAGFSMFTPLSHYYIGSHSCYHGKNVITLCNIG